jgi:hypothetical protein
MAVPPFDAGGFQPTHPTLHVSNIALYTPAPIRPPCAVAVPVGALGVVAGATVVVIVGATVVVVIAGAAVVVVMVMQFLLSTLKLLVIGVAVFGKFSKLIVALYILGDVPMSSLKYSCLLLMVKYAASAPRNLKA